MRRIVLTTALVLSAALFGCSGGAQAPTSPSGEGQALTTPTPTVSTDAGLNALKASLDSQVAKPGFMEIIDADSGAVLSHSDVALDGSGLVAVGDRTDQGFHPYNQPAFHVQLNLDTNGQYAPGGGYSQSGNPVYFVGQTVCYDASITRTGHGHNRLFRLGTFDLQFRHEFATNEELFPECVPGQNPRTISGVNYRTQEPCTNGCSWSPDGKTMSSTGMLFKLCNLPGVQYGTDQICLKITWVIPNGHRCGLRCNNCEIHVVVYDRCLGVYDPPPP